MISFTLEPETIHYSELWGTCTPEQLAEILWNVEAEPSKITDPAFTRSEELRFMATWAYRSRVFHENMKYINLELGIT